MIFTLLIATYDLASNGRNSLKKIFKPNTINNVAKLPQKTDLISEVEGIIGIADTSLRHQKILDFIGKRTLELENGAKITSLSLKGNAFYKGFIHPETQVNVNNINAYPIQINDDMIYKELLNTLHNLKREYPEVDLNKLIYDAVLITISNYFGDNWFEDTGRERVKFFTAGVKSLSDILDLELLKGRSIAECVEKSAVAQNLLAFMGVESYLIFTDKCKLDREGFSSHTYNVLVEKTHYLLFDPTNPTMVFNPESKPEQVIPAIYRISADDFQNLKRGESIEVVHQNYLRQGNNLIQKDLSYRIYGGPQI